MVDKSALQNLTSNLSVDGLTIPTDFVKMRSCFKHQLVSNYFNQLGLGQRVLDLNPGIDGLHNELKHKDIRYFALEQNPNIRTFLKEKDISVKDWKIPFIPLEDDSVDIVISAPFIEHLPTYVDALNLLIEAKRVLKPEGRILIIAPNYMSLKDMYYGDYKHSWVITKDRLSAMLTDCGYQVMSARYTIGWITMKMNPLTALFRFVVSLVMSFLGISIVDRLLETLRLKHFTHKFKKTFFELIIIDAKIHKEH